MDEQRDLARRELTQRIVAETHRFHDALAAWLADGDRAAFETIERAMHADLTLFDQTGAIVGRAELLDGLARAGASRPGLRIEIDEVDVILGAGEGTVIGFRERHTRDGELTVRRTTALLVEQAARPGALLWRHVHETAVGT